MKTVLRHEVTDGTRVLMLSVLSCMFPYLMSRTDFHRQERLNDLKEQRKSNYVINLRLKHTHGWWQSLWIGRWYGSYGQVSRVNEMVDKKSSHSNPSQSLSLFFYFKYIRIDLRVRTPWKLWGNLCDRNIWKSCNEYWV